MKKASFLSLPLLIFLMKPIKYSETNYLYKEFGEKVWVRIWIFTTVMLE